MASPTDWEVVVRALGDKYVLNRHTHKTSRGALQCQRHLINAFGLGYLVEASPVGTSSARERREVARQRRVDRQAALDKG